MRIKLIIKYPQKLPESNGKYGCNCEVNLKVILFFLLSNYGLLFCVDGLDFCIIYTNSYINQKTLRFCVKDHKIKLQKYILSAPLFQKQVVYLRNMYALMWLSIHFYYIFIVFKRNIGIHIWTMWTGAPEFTNWF